MSGSAVATPPSVDDGDDTGLTTSLLAMLAPSWGRLHATLLVVVPMIVVLAIWETFRIPNVAIACMMLLMMARSDTLSTIGTSFAVAVSVSIGAIVAIVAICLSLSQPAVRIPLMALMTFTTMMMVGGTSVGPVAFIIGFFATYGSTSADDLMSLATSTSDVTNTEGFGRPQIAYFPPEEALLHSLLWLSMAAVIPALLLVIAHRLAGSNPRRLLLRKFRDRTETITAFCRDEPGAADRLHAVAREGMAPMLDLVGVAERAGSTGALHEAHLRCIRSLNRLVLLMIAWEMARVDTQGDARADNSADARTDMAASDVDAAAFLQPIGAFAAALTARLRLGHDSGLALPPAPPNGSEDLLGGALPSLATEMRVVLDTLRSAELERAHALNPRGPTPRPPSKPFLLPTAFTAGNIHFALKVTMTVMISYLIESGLDWQAINTCVVTCFFVALGTIGETLHKMRLRIVGCLIGAVLGIAAILWLMPSMTGFGQLAILFVPVAFASTWIGFGSQRISYAGWQILLAFALVVLQGFGPTLDMQTGRDRVIGILLGNLVTTLVFLFVWPVRVADTVRRDIATGFDTLGELMAIELDDPSPADPRRADPQPADASHSGRRQREAELRDRFTAMVAKVGAVIPNDHLEPKHTVRTDEEASAGHLGRNALARLVRLIVPVSVIVTDGVELGERDAIPQALRDDMQRFHLAMHDWFGLAATWVRTGEGSDRLRAALPRPPASERLPDMIPPALARHIRSRAALYTLLRRQIDAFLDEALPSTPVSSPLPRSASLALG